MSRYGGGDFPPRSSGPPPTERWDNDRFTRERSGRSVIEKDRFEERDRYAAPLPTRRRESSADHLYSSRGAPFRRGYEEDEVDERFYEREERYGPPARREPPPPRQVREQRRYYEEDDYEEDDGPGPRRFAGGRGGGWEGRNPPRPGMLVRRQSSLDTFDRKPMRYREPEVITVPPPRGGRGKEEKHRYEPRYAERDYEEMDIRIAEPDRYGDERFRGWREREVETIRRRKPSRSPSRERVEKEEVVIEEEKPWPRRGRTRMSAKLVNKRALVQLGYPYEDELTDEGDFVIILKALNKELIDEVLGLSKEYNARMTAAFQIEAPPQEREVIERREIVIPEPDDVPRSVREWDVMSGSLGGAKSDHGGHGSVAASHKSHRSHKSKHSIHRSRSTHRHRSSSSSSRSTVKKGRHSRSPSPVVIIRSKSHHRSRSSAGHKTEIDAVEEEQLGESNDIAVGPLSLVVPHTKKRSNSRDERKIKEEILELEEEKRRLKKERKERKHHHHHHHKDSSDDEDEVIIERVPSGGHRSRKRDEDEIIIERDHGRSHSRRRDDDEIIIERSHGGGHGKRKEEEIKIEKDRKGSTDAKLMKAMFATLT